MKDLWSRYDPSSDLDLKSLMGFGFFNAQNQCIFMLFYQKVGLGKARVDQMMKLKKNDSICNISYSSYPFSAHYINKKCHKDKSCANVPKELI